MSTTTNYNLIKPEYSDDADIADINGNMDIVDNALKTNADNIALKQNITDDTLTTTAQTIPTAINEVNALAKETSGTYSNVSGNLQLSFCNIKTKGTIGIMQFQFKVASDTNAWTKLFDTSIRPNQALYVKAYNITNYSASKRHRGW